MTRYIIVFAIYCSMCLLVLPMGVSGYYINSEEATTAYLEKTEELEETQETQETQETEEVQETVIPVDLSQKVINFFNKKENTTTLENYVIGVVAAEMPALFNEEALKAQAVASRTYALNQMNSQNVTVEYMIKNGGQAYNTVEQMKSKWSEDFNKYYEKIVTAVLATENEIMVYEEEPILAVFHAMSRGKTEVAENLWGESKPYLKSVDSPMDLEAKDYSYTTTMSVETVAALLQKSDKELKLYSGSLKEQMQVIDRTEAGYINTIQIGNRVFTGKQVREILGLRSSDFTFKQEGNNIIFTTLGYGHGAGMSQMGANFMAAEGKNYKEILNYYYSGIKFEKIN